VIFQDFPGPGIFKKKIQDFPGGCVGTLKGGGGWKKTDFDPESKKTSNYLDSLVDVLLVSGELISSEEAVRVAGDAVTDAVAFTKQSASPQHTGTVLHGIEVLVITIHLPHTDSLRVHNTLAQSFMASRYLSSPYTYHTPTVRESTTHWHSPSWHRGTCHRRRPTTHRHEAVRESTTHWHSPSWHRGTCHHCTPTTHRLSSPYHHQHTVYQ